jgi:putative heme degradation protein
VRRRQGWLNVFDGVFYRHMVDEINAQARVT